MIDMNVHCKKIRARVKFDLFSRFEFIVHFDELKYYTKVRVRVRVRAVIFF